MNRKFKAVPGRGIVASVVVASSDSEAQSVFDATKEFVVGDWPLEIEEPGFIAWFDDSGNGMKTLTIDEIRSELSRDPLNPELYDEVDYGLACVVAYPIDEAIQIFEDHDKGVPSWLKQEFYSK